MIPYANPFGNGTTSQQILTIIKQKFYANKLDIGNFSFNEKIPFTKLVKFELDERISVEDYEKMNNCEIMEIFDLEGNPKIPTASFQLEKGLQFRTRYF